MIIIIIIININDTQNNVIFSTVRLDLKHAYFFNSFEMENNILFFYLKPGSPRCCAYQLPGTHKNTGWI